MTAKQNPLIGPAAMSPAEALEEANAWVFWRDQGRRWPGPGKAYERLPAHLRDALKDLQSSDLKIGRASCRERV